jgi:hypothetical protein
MRSHPPESGRLHQGKQGPPRTDILIDSRYAFISSADLTRDSFYDHYEAGFLVKDEDMVHKAVSFFEKVWQESVEP